MGSRGSGSGFSLTTNNSTRASLQTVPLKSAATTPDDHDDDFDGSAAAVLGRRATTTNFNLSPAVAHGDDDDDDTCRLLALECGTAAAAYYGYVSAKKVAVDIHAPFARFSAEEEDKEAAAGPPWWKGGKFDNAAAAAARKGGGLGGGLLDWYAKALEARPLLSKCVTSAVVGALGDLCAQGVFSARGGDGMWHDTQVSYSTSIPTLNNSYTVSGDRYRKNRPY